MYSTLSRLHSTPVVDGPTVHELPVTEWVVFQTSREPAGHASTQDMTILKRDHQ